MVNKIEIKYSGNKDSRHQVLLVLAAILLSALQVLSAREVDVYTSNLPPLVMDDGEQYGIVGDLLREAVTRAGYNCQFKFFPWKRSQALVSRGEDRLIIPLSRTPQRENLYTWIAATMPVSETFVALNGPVNSIAEAKSFDNIIVGLGTAQYELLREAGIPVSKIMAVPSDSNELALLEGGRAKTWFTSVPELRWALEEHPESLHLAVGAAAAEAEIYIACSKRCDAQLVTGIQSSFDSMQQDGTAQRIENRYKPYMGPEFKQASK